ncbi:MAG: hypothetical protein WDM96_17185 [Lacunisphaera sp.]
MLLEILSRFTFGATTVLYVTDPATGRVGLELCPTAIVAEAVPRDAKLDTPEVRALPADWRPTDRVSDRFAGPAQMCGDDYAGDFAQGRTMRNSASALSLRFESPEPAG